MSRLTPPNTPRLDDPKAESARRELAQKVRELQQLPAAFLDVIPNVTLRDGVPTPVSHGLGRPVKWAKESCVVGAVTAGVVTTVPSSTHDPRLWVVLQADGFGADVTCSVAVM